jgi:hypothetical protein
MAVEPALIAIFGTGAAQTATDLTISKAGLQATGYTFTPSASNRAEQLFLAILLKAKSGQDTSEDSQMRISEPTMSLVNVPKPGDPEYIKARYQYTIQVDADVITKDPSPDGI